MNSLMNAMYGHRIAGIFGYSHLTGGFAGGQAEYVRVPKGAVNLLPIPDGVPDGERSLKLLSWRESVAAASAALI